MKTLLCLLLFASPAHALFIDLGEPGTCTQRSYTLPVSYLLQGQTIALDLEFSNSITTRSPFGIEIAFGTDTAQLLPALSGSGYLLGSSPQSLVTFSDVDGDLFADYWIDQPFVFSGAHFDLTLPTAGGHFIEYGQITLFSRDGFHIGAVPESGATLALLAVACGSLMCFRYIKT